MDKDQERDLSKLEGEAAADEFVPDTKAPEKPQAVSLASQQVAGYVVMGASAVFSVMASKRGKHWLLTGEEVEELHKATALVAQKYMVFDMSNPLYGLAGVCLAIAAPRLMSEFTQGEKGGEGGDKPEHQMAE